MSSNSRQSHAPSPREGETLVRSFCLCGPDLRASVSPLRDDGKAKLCPCETLGDLCGQGGVSPHQHPGGWEPWTSPVSETCLSWGSCLLSRPCSQSQNHLRRCRTHHCLQGKACHCPHVTSRRFGSGKGSLRSLARRVWERWAGPASASRQCLGEALAAVGAAGHLPLPPPSEPPTPLLQT